MPFRARLPDETDQQHSLRRSIWLIRQSYLEPTEVTNQAGTVVMLLQPGDGITYETYNRFVDAFATWNGLVNNPPRGGLGFLSDDCFGVNPAEISISPAESLQYWYWDCDVFFAELEQAAAGMVTAMADARSERLAYVESLSWTEPLTFRDDGQSATIDEIIVSDVERQKNIQSERENVRSAATETPTWGPLALAGILGYFVLRATRG